jgi:fumarate reductase subunit D
MERDPAGAPVLGEVLGWSEEGQVVAPARRRAAVSGRVRQSRAEAFAWALFSAGGFVGAVVLPINIAVIGVAYAAGWLPDRTMSFARVLHLARNPLVKLYLLAVIALPLFHWAHRFRFAIHHQFGIQWKRLVAALCYGTAIAGTGLAIYLLIVV